jgi:hypothetical protein
VAPPVPLIPQDPCEAGRWQATAAAWRLLYGEWRGDLEARVQSLIGNVRREAWGAVDLSANLFRQVWDAIATLYDTPPTVDHETEQGKALGELITASGYWSRMQRIQRDTLGLREMLVRVDVAGEGPTAVLTYRSVLPHAVILLADPDRPDVPVEIWEARRRWLPGATRAEEWWDHLCIRPGAEVYEVVTNGGEDRSGILGDRGRMSGAAYPYRDQAGNAVLPYVLYHAQDTGQLFDWRSTAELTEGTYNCGVYYSLYGHVLRNCAWKQRYAVGVDVVGAALQGTDANGVHRGVVTDPATLVIFRNREGTDGDPEPIEIGQWDDAADPRAMIESIMQYEQRLVSFAGINAADQMRMSGDPRSGYAVSVSRDSQRQVQRRYEPVFRRADLELLRVSAILANLAGIGSYPEDGYTLAYQGIPLSGEEQTARRENVVGLLDAGLYTRMEAYLAVHPGASEADAARALSEIDTEAKARAKAAADEARQMAEAAPPTPSEPEEQPVG